MKKISLFAAMAAVAMSAGAQYTCDPSNTPIIEQKPTQVYSILLAAPAIEQFKAGGAEIYDWSPNENDGRNLWYWDGLTPGDETLPRVDMEEGGYVSVEVTGTAGWSGAGFNASAVQPNKGLDLSKFNEDTRFHMAYVSPNNNAPVQVMCTVLDNTTESSKKFQFCIGTAGVDNGVAVPSIAPKATDEWVGIDLSFAQMKKLYPNCAVETNPYWSGNYFAWLAGNVAGTTIAFDAMYFYNIGDNSGVEGIESEKAMLIVTDHTINTLGTTGIEVYNMAGAKVKSSNGSVLGIDNLAKGVYVAKSGKTVKKFVVK